jgi:AraC-like DNA-binding protein
MGTSLASMRRVSPEELLESPIGNWAATDTAVVWCHSPTLGGVVSWGRPNLEDTRATFHLVDLYRHPAVSPRFNIVTDGRALEGVDVEGIGFMIGWIRSRIDELRRRIVLQVGIIPDGTIGILLAGIMPLAGEGHPFRVFTNRRQALHVLAPTFGDVLEEELNAAVGQVRGLAPEVRRLRELLQDRDGDISQSDAARCMGSSTRSLQRALSMAGTSFREEQLKARFAVACDLLENSDLKVSSVAARLGISERALTQLFSARGALPPSEHRGRFRSS